MSYVFLKSYLRSVVVRRCIDEDSQRFVIFVLHHPIHAISFNSESATVVGHVQCLKLEAVISCCTKLI